MESYSAEEKQQGCNNNNKREREKQTQNVSTNTPTDYERSQEHRRQLAFRHESRWAPVQEAWPWEQGGNQLRTTAPKKQTDPLKWKKQSQIQAVLVTPDRLRTRLQKRALAQNVNLKPWTTRAYLAKHFVFFLDTALRVSKDSALLRHELAYILGECTLVERLGSPHWIDPSFY